MAFVTGLVVYQTGMRKAYGMEWPTAEVSRHGVIEHDDWQERTLPSEKLAILREQWSQIVGRPHPDWRVAT